MLAREEDIGKRSAPPPPQVFCWAGKQRHQSEAELDVPPPLSQTNRTTSALICFHSVRWKKTSNLTINWACWIVRWLLFTAHCQPASFAQLYLPLKTASIVEWATPAGSIPGPSKFSWLAAQLSLKHFRRNVYTKAVVDDAPHGRWGMVLPYWYYSQLSIMDNSCIGLV